MSRTAARAWLYWNEARAEAAARHGNAPQYTLGLRAIGICQRDLTWIASSLWFGPTPVERGTSPLPGDAR